MSSLHLLYRTCKLCKRNYPPSIFDTDIDECRFCINALKHYNKSYYQNTIVIIHSNYKTVTHCAMPANWNSCVHVQDYAILQTVHLIETK